MLAFHLIVSAYGFWLPNDPRGSWSDFVGAWELLKFGPATKADDDRNYARDPHDVSLRRAAKQALKFPPVRFTADQRVAIAAGFAQACTDADYHCHACCVGYDHAHLVIAAHARLIDIIAGHLKSAATRSMTAADIHPLAGHLGKRGGLPRPWAEGCWKVYLDTPDHVASAIRYVTRHPEKERLPPQPWPFIHSVDPTQLTPRRAAHR